MGFQANPRTVSATTDTPTTADDGKQLIVSNASGCAFTLTTTGWTVGVSAFPIAVLSGAGAATFVAGSGVTVYPSSARIGPGEQGVASYIASGVWFVSSRRVATGTAAPATTPGAIGDIFVDTTNEKVYVAAGTSASTDWISVDGRSVLSTTIRYHDATYATPPTYDTSPPAGYVDIWDNLGAAP